MARFIGEIVSELNLKPILDVYWRKDARGAEAYHPELLTRLLLYGLATRLTSSRRIEKASYDSVPFRYLAADQHPDHDTIAAFRQQHLEALAALFVEALRLCRKAGLVKLANVAIDGTKLMANAGWGRGRSHAKMSEEEQQRNETVKRWMEEAQRTDADEDARFGKEERGIREFRLRGFKKTKAEWLLICLTHNLLKLSRHEWLPKRASGGPGSDEKPENEQKSCRKSSCRLNCGVGSAARAKLAKNARQDPTAWHPCRGH